jgi:hypothetical protein
MLFYNTAFFYNASLIDERFSGQVSPCGISRSEAPLAPRNRKKDIAITAASITRNVGLARGRPMPNNGKRQPTVLRRLDREYSISGGTAA